MNEYEYEIRQEVYEEQENKIKELEEEIIVLQRTIYMQKQTKKQLIKKIDKLQKQLQKQRVQDFLNDELEDVDDRWGYNPYQE